MDLEGGMVMAASPRTKGKMSKFAIDMTRTNFILDSRMAKQVYD